MKEKKFPLITVIMIGVMAAMVYIVTLFRFPLLGSKVHFANAVCLLAGLLLGPVPGGLAAGLGSMLYDAFAGYGLVEALITFVSKFAMAWVCGRLYQGLGDFTLKKLDKTLLSCILGALTYVALYMLKTFIFQRFVYGFPMDTVFATMLSKLIPSLINAGAAVVAAPIFFHALVPALRSGGVMDMLRPAH
ncbi:MAG: ECF transporter S component [Clostridiales bacterium]|nr:ECF transporter S component [Clostridiales bacterium]